MIWFADGNCPTRTHTRLVRIGSPPARAVSRTQRATLAPADDPWDSPASTLDGLKEIFAPEPGLRPWEKVRVSLAIALILNVGVGVVVGVKLSGKDPRLAGWEDWLFLAPFILLGVVPLAAFVGRLIVATKYTWDEKSSRSRRTLGRRGSQVGH